MGIAEQIYTLVKSLPEDQASEILTFAESIQARQLKTAHSPNLLPWVELVHSLAGTWGEDFPDLEDIRVESGQDSFRESF